MEEDMHNIIVTQRGYMGPLVKAVAVPRPCTGG
jgi:hypothetical protein